MSVLRSLVLYLLVVSGYSFTSPVNAQKPNIILIVADDLGWNDVGFHNPEMITPHLDELAKKGIELRRFYVGALCSPTRAGLLTGKYPDRFGLRGVVGPRAQGGLPVQEKTIADVLADAGYKKRGAFGKWHLGHSDARFHPMQRGFTSFYGHYNGAIDYFTHYRNGALDWHQDYAISRDTGYSMDLITDRAVRFISESAKEPFFAYIALNSPHTPLQAKEEDLLKYNFRSDKEMQDFEPGGYQKSEHNGPEYGRRGRGNTARQTYSAMVTALDRSVGEIVKVVKETGIAENTIIWFLSDNGGDVDFGASNLPLRGEKQTEWEGGVRSVSLIKWGKHLAGGSVNEEVMGYVDILPTLMNITGSSLKSDLDGFDIHPYLKGKPMPERIFFLGNEAIVSRKWKLNKGQLFDLENDISESTDLASLFPFELSKMLRSLEEFKKIVNPNPLIFHPVDWKPVSWEISKQ
jgi:arylsulfatase B